ncbi:MAG: PAS domain-containing protein [Cyclobacteriaceae bacterium]|nr:PAS domain-containing protein [Cyclobacteriaceae bacterium]
MKYSFQDFTNNRKNKFGQLALWYILALCTVATVIIIGQVLIQKHLSSQQSDSRIVNIAGRQRMLSQKIAKLALQLEDTLASGTHEKLSEELAATTRLWQKSHLALRVGDPEMHLPGNNSQAIDSMFRSIEKHHVAIYESAETLAGWQQSKRSSGAELTTLVHTILANEGLFLIGMDKIVYQYDLEAKQKVNSLSQMEYMLLAISLLVIFLEVVFIFRPTARQVSKTMGKLIESEKQAIKMTKEISAIYSSLEKSYEQLAKVNEPDDMPRVWARADKGGNVSWMSNTLQHITGLQNARSLRICDLFPGAGLGDDFMDELVEVISNHENWSGQVWIKQGGHEYWVEVTICPVLNLGNEVGEVLVIATDITGRKHAEQDMYRKNRNEIETRINQQKYRSVLILEGQEEERKRLAMDIHDGIGQHLTSLKFQIEGIDPEECEINARKLAEIKAQLSDTIKEVRRVTFNLKPTVLGDYGLASGLRMFVSEISKYSELKINFTNPGHLTDRFSQRLENNVFRIVQEAINNAIKYAKAGLIDVSIMKTKEELLIVVKDDGVGFDPSQLHDVGIASGSGFFNMYERTAYINGKLEIDSVPGKGTRVELRVPVKPSANNGSGE